MTDEPTLKINTSNDRITVVFKTHEPKRVRARQAHRAGVPHAVMNVEAWTDKKIYAAMSQRLKAAKGQGGVNSTCNGKPRRFSIIFFFIATPWPEKAAKSSKQ
jgi:hypothetical protein